MSNEASNPATHIEVGRDFVAGTKVEGDQYNIAGNFQQTIVQGLVIEDIEQLPPEAGTAPYRGLQYFDEEHAEWFFGREKLTAALVHRLYDTNFLAVVGDSGSGKSSVVRAGVIPALKRTMPLVDGSVPPLGDWQVRVLTPTARPLEKLVATLFPDDMSQQTAVFGRLSANPHTLREAIPSDPARPLLLVIDQFEELFSQCKDESQREAFIANVVAAARPTCKIVLTLRADFYAPCLRYEPLRRILKEGQEPLGPMSREELTAAILAPSAKGNWQFQVGLVEEMLEDVGQEPGALPLLSHALRETWERRRGRVLTLSGYREAGGVKGAIAKTAEGVYQALPSAEQTIAQQIFLRLTELGEGTQDTRRRVGRGELREDGLTAEVTRKLAEARLVTTSAGGIEVAHEALIREWPQLRAWLDADREGLVIHRRLTNGTAEWLAKGEEGSLLYTGLRLAEAEQWAEGNREQLNEQEERFLQASVAARARAEAEAEENERNKQELYVQREVKKQIQASRLALASQIELKNDPETALLLAIGSMNVNNQVDTCFLLSEILQNPYRTTLYGHTSVVNSANFSFDGQTILTASADGTAKLWNTQGENLHSLFHGDKNEVYLAIFSPNDQTILTVCKDCNFYLWDKQGNKKAAYSGHENQIKSAMFSPNGTIILTASEDNTARLWHIQENTITVLQHKGVVNSALFNHQTMDVVLTASSDGSAILWDIEGNKLQNFSPDEEGEEIKSATFFPDSETVLGLSSSNLIYLWDKKGMILYRFSDGYPIDSITVSPNGHIMLIAFSNIGDNDVFLELWDKNMQVLATLDRHKDSIQSAYFSSSGQLILTASKDGTARLWDIKGNQLISLVGHSNKINSSLFSPYQHSIATASADNTARLWAKDNYKLIISPNDTNQYRIFDINCDGEIILKDYANENIIRICDKEGRDIATLEGQTGKIGSSGQSIFTADTDGTMRLWDRNGNQLSCFQCGNDKKSWNISDLNEQYLLAIPSEFNSSNHKMAELWDWQGNTLARFCGHEDSITSAIFSPNGQTVLTISRDNTVRLWDTQGHEKAILGKYKDRIISAAFSLKMKINIFTADIDDTVRIWDELGNQLAILSGHKYINVHSAMFSPDGQTILTVNQNHAILWDLQGNKLAILRGHTNNISKAFFCSDGQTILAMYYGGTAWSWPSYTVEYMVQEAFWRVKRGFTEAECQQYFRDDVSACPRTKKQLFAPLLEYLSPSQQQEWAALPEE